MVVGVRAYWCKHHRRKKCRRHFGRGRSAVGGQALGVVRCAGVGRCAGVVRCAGVGVGRAGGCAVGGLALGGSAGIVWVALCVWRSGVCRWSCGCAKCGRHWWAKCRHHKGVGWVGRQGAGIRGWWAVGRQAGVGWKSAGVIGGKSEGVISGWKCWRYRSACGCRSASGGRRAGWCGGKSKVGRAGGRVGVRAGRRAGRRQKCGRHLVIVPTVQTGFRIII
jgi:hypothetical protein